MEKETKLATKRKATKRKRSAATAPVSRPALPKRLPASWGRRRTKLYSLMRSAMLDLTDPDQTLQACVTIAQFLETCPRASDAFLRDAWDAIRTWHEARKDNVGSEVPCPQCGERRPECFQAEGSVTRHAAVVTIRGPFAHVAPHGCEHAKLVVSCSVCGALVSDTLTALVDHATGESIEPTEDEKKWSIN